MKSLAWRRYYGYRPQTLAELGRLTDDQIRAQEAQYRRWLIAMGRIALSDADLAKAQADAAEAVASAQQWVEDCRARLALKRRSVPLRRTLASAEQNLREAEAALEMSRERKRELLEERQRTTAAPWRANR